MIETILMPFIWILFGVFTIWFFFVAKTTQALSLEDLALTWKIHREQKRCKSDHIQHLINEKNEIIGFQCGCGYEFKQNRLIFQTILRNPLSSKIQQGV